MAKKINPAGALAAPKKKAGFMGIGRILKKGMGGGLRLASKIVKSPIGRAASFIPGIGTAATAISMGAGAYGAMGGFSGNKGVPQFKGGLPALPGVGPNRSGGMMMPMGRTGSFGLPRGPGGRMQLPWNDPSVPAMIKAYALDDSYIKPVMRAPRGYVIVRDPDGQPYPLERQKAIQLRLWRPAKKPPISVRDFQALKRADRTVKKMRKIMTMTQSVDKHVGKGGKVSFKKRSRK